MDELGEFSKSSKVLPSEDDANNEAAPGNVYARDYTAGGLLEFVVDDMVAAYNNVDGLPEGELNRKSGHIGDETFAPGVYTFTRDINIGAATEVTFDGGGNPAAVFIMKTTGSIVQAAYTKVILSNSAKAENIFWQVAGNVAVNAGAEMQGVILAKTEVTFVTDSKLNGRVLTQTACNLGANVEITEAVIEA
jgi:hypothetical protein